MSDYKQALALLSGADALIDRLIKADGVLADKVV